MEALAERFHTTPETLIALNSPQTKVGPNRVIRVPNIPNIDPAMLGEDARGWNRTLETLAVAPEQPMAAKVVVDKSEGLLRVYDADDTVIAQFPATMGSEHEPLPIGIWKIQGVNNNPDFHYNPKLCWDVSDKIAPQLLKPGPKTRSTSWRRAARRWSPQQREPFQSEAGGITAYVRCRTGAGSIIIMPTSTAMRPVCVKGSRSAPATPSVRSARPAMPIQPPRTSISPSSPCGRATNGGRAVNPYPLLTPMLMPMLTVARAASSR